MVRWLELEAPASDLSVLDRQGACLNGQQQHQQQLAGIGDIVPLRASMQLLHNSNDHERSGNISYNHHQIGSHGNGWPNIASTKYLTIGAATTAEEETSIKEQSNNSRKRKVENISNQKVRCGNTAEDDMRDKRAKEDRERGGGGGAAKQSPQANNKMVASGDASKENAKPPKTDYIHVRARRGQATDSHSLAERVRRERISERMKYLQELVPGCSNITGKAGILDQIINYVQSLQRQVEFLSMKLAAVNPRLDFDMDNFFNGEINLACNSGVMPLIDLSSEQLDPYIQFTCLHPASASCGLDMAMGSSGMVLHRTMSLPASVPEAILDSTLSVHGSSSSWNTGLQDLYGVEFHQGRGPAFPFQSLQGDILPRNLEMEM